MARRAGGGHAGRDRAAGRKASRGGGKAAPARSKARGGSAGGRAVAAGQVREHPPAPSRRGGGPRGRDDVPRVQPQRSAPAGHHPAAGRLDRDVPQLPPDHLRGGSPEPARPVTRVVVKSALSELLRFIAANEDLPRTRVRYPGYDRDTLGKLINAAADRIEDLEKGREAAPGGNKGITVRRQSDVAKAAARAAVEIDEAMDLSRLE